MKSGFASKYFRKASMYEMLAAYYKYTNMHLHIHFYKKHMKYLQKAIFAEKLRFQNTDRNAGSASLRVLHAVPDASEVDIYVNGVRILTEFPYKKATEYLFLPEGKYQIDIYPTGNQVATIISRKVEVQKGKYYTLAAYGQGKKLNLLSFEDNPYTNNGEAKLRFIHLSPDSPAVDISIRNGDTAFGGIQPRQVSNYLNTTPMALDLDIKAAVTGQKMVDLPRIQLQPNVAHTVYIIGLSDGDPSMEAIMLAP